MKWMTEGSSTISHREYFKMHGRLGDSRIEDLLDVADVLDRIPSIIDKIDDATNEISDDGLFSAISEAIDRFPNIGQRDRAYLINLVTNNRIDFANRMKALTTKLGEVVDELSREARLIDS